MAQNVFLSSFSVAAVLVLLELFFRLVFAQSDAINYTLASKNWFDRYWSVNSLGYRDIEWTPDLLDSRTKIMVVGDSFVAGHGVKNPRDRFPDVLGEKLGDEYAVINLGVCGANTTSEIQKALAYPHASDPEIVILSFYLDDIQDTALSMGLEYPPLEVRDPPVLASAIRESYALNFFYWRMARLGPQDWIRKYWDWLWSVYDNPGVWEKYEDELLQISHYTKERHIQLIVVVFPNPLAVEKSRYVTSKVVNLYKEEDVPVLDVAELIRGMNPRDIIVNPTDAHANEFLHRLVAEELYRMASHELGIGKPPNDGSPDAK